VPIEIFHQRTPSVFLFGGICRRPARGYTSIVLRLVPALVLFFQLSCKQSGPADITVPQFVYPDPYPWATSTPRAQGLDPDTIAQALVQLQGLPYVESFVLVRNGFLVTEAYYTMAGQYTFASVASVSKSFTSALVGIALREKYLDSLGQKLVDFFPEYVTPALDPRKRDITVEHLITMRAGFDADESQDYSNILNPTTDWMKEIIGLPMKTNPGQVFNYSSLNAHLVSGILTKASHMSTMTLAQRFLLQPAVFSVISWPQDPQGYYFAGSNLVFYPRDLARFGYLYVSDGWLNGQSIIPADWVKASIQPHDDNSRTWGAFKNVKYGYMWWTAQWDTLDIFLAVGFGGQFIVGVPRYNLVIVITSNLNCTNAEADQRHLAVLDIVAKHLLNAVVR
jgi:CubicO group peptidase (beta-lactamase class C family)